MKKRTRQLIGFAAISALLAGSASGMFTQNGVGLGWGGHHGMMGTPAAGFYPGHMYGDYSPEVTAERLDALKQRIGITADQDSAWSEYTAAVAAKVDLMQSHRNTLFGVSYSDVDQIQSRHQQGVDTMQKIFNATRNLYAVLTPEQQARAGNLIGLHHGLR